MRVRGRHANMRVLHECFLVVSCSTEGTLLEHHEPYSPLDKTNLGSSVAEALLRSPALCLPPPQPFLGAGIYAIYYSGEHPLYQRIAERNAHECYLQPIYVGRAVPKGRRKGGKGLVAPPGNELHTRLCQHAKSIGHAKNLDLEHFRCRYLVVDDIWIALGEALIIEMFSPVWNTVLDGFGNHDPGRGRSEGQRPAWDVVHPGRPWASRCRENKKSKTQIIEEVKSFLSRDD